MSLRGSASCRTIAALAFVVACGGGVRAGRSPPVRVRAGPDDFVIENGLVRMRLASDGTLVGLMLGEGGNLVANGGKGYWNGHSRFATKTRGYVALRGPGGVLRQSDEVAEVAFRHEPGGRWPHEAFPFDARLHYCLRRGESGFYIFMTLRYAPPMPAAAFAQNAYNLRLDPARFDYIAVSDERRHVSHSPADEKKAERIMDATYRLPGGRVVTKYDYCHDIEQDRYHVYGWASSPPKGAPKGTTGATGVWLIQPSAEYYPCTPFKRVITSHQTTTTPVIIWQPHCTHAGGTEMELAPGETWHKLYGPLFFHLNSGRGHDELWADAKRRHAELAAEWPYRWMRHEWFPVERGTVTGELRFAGGGAVRDAYVILSPPGVNWSTEVRGYHFWTRTEDDGRFVVRGVREGTYTLFACGADRFREFVRQEVRVEAERTAALGTLAWEPAPRGRRVWQIGTADRTTGEFRNGDDYRHWGLWRRYPEDFPDGVRFVVGTSRERADWNFAHWNWHSGEAAWRIEFDMAERSRGKATLTFGIAAAAPYDPRRKQLTRRGTTDVLVRANGREVGRIELPFTGSVAYRSARHSTKYNVVTIPFDAALLRSGGNTVTLRHAQSDEYRAGDPMGERGAGPGYVMYDAIRLEVDGR